MAQGTTYHFRINGVSAGGTTNGLDQQFTTLVNPIVSSISPTSGSTAGGTAVTITGTNFTGATSVTIGGNAATGITVVNSTTITCTTPAGTAGLVNVTVTTPAGAATPNGIYTYTVPSFVVTVATDNVASPPAGSLRAAIVGANATSGATITFGSLFSSSQTITLAGTLNITSSMTITGPGATFCTIAGTSTSGSNNFPLMAINSVPANGTVTISGLGMTKGGNSGSNGSAIEFDSTGATLNLTSCDLFSNFGTTSTFYTNGSKNINFTGCTFRTNGTTAVVFGDSSGGYSLTNCTFSGNLNRSIIISPNAAPVSTALLNCTLDANFQTDARNSSITTTLKNSIIAGVATVGANSNTLTSLGNNINTTASPVLAGTGDQNNVSAGALLLGTLGVYGGQVQVLPLLPGSVAIRAGTATGAPAQDARGATRLSPPCIGAYEARAFTPTFGSPSGNSQSTMVNTAFALPLKVNVAGLGADAVDGGVVTFTAPSSGASLNPAVSTVTISGGVAALTATANGTVGASYTVNATVPNASAVSFTLTNTVPTFVVTTNADSGAGSLRTAITSANATSGATITFDPTFFNVQRTITLASALPTITQNVTITGPGANLCTVSGSSQYQPFSISAANLNVTISGLTIANGSTSSYGGGLLCNSTGTVNINNVVFQNNTTGVGAGGGGACNFSSGTLNLTGCLFSGNTATNFSGGGVLNNSTGSVTLTNCTFSGNQATSTGRGGAVGNFTSGTIILTSCTIVGNTAQFGGGLVSNTANTITIQNCIVANNTAPNGPDINVAVISSGNNLIGNTTGGSGFVASDIKNVLPLVGTLGYYPASASIQTIPLLPGSPAINAGASGGNVPTTDARGVARVGLTDIGAFEAQAFTLALTSGNNQSATVSNAFAAPLVVTVTATGNDPVANGSVTFAAPASGAGLSLANTTVPIGAVSAGTAQLSATANATAGGPYTVAATAAGASPTINFSLTNTLPDYSITKSGGTLTITDNSNNSDTLAITEPSAGNILFAAATRTFSVNGAANTTNNSGNISLTGITSIVVNAAGGNDIIAIGAFTATSYSFTIDGGTGTNSVSVAGTFTTGVFNPTGGGATLTLSGTKTIGVSNIASIDLSVASFATATVNIDPAGVIGTNIITTVASADTGVNTLVSFSAVVPSIKIGSVSTTFIINGATAIAENNYFLIQGLGNTMLGDFAVVGANSGGSDVIDINTTTLTVAGTNKNLSLTAAFVGIGRVDAAPGSDAPGVISCSGNITITATGDSTFSSASPLWNTTTPVVATGVWGALPAYFNATLLVSTLRGSIEVRGDILKTAGNDATLTLKATCSITFPSVVASTGNLTGRIISSNNKLITVIQADSDALNFGSVVMQHHAVITTNGGDLTIGGGATPLTSPANGTGGSTIYGAGVYLQSAQLTSGGGNISIRGKGADNSSTTQASGVALSVAVPTVDCVIDSGTGNMNIVGVSGTNTTSTILGVSLSGGTSNTVHLKSTTGNITINGSCLSTGAATTSGFLIQTNADIKASGAGNISITGSTVATVNSTNTADINISATSPNSAVISSVGGNVTFIGDSMNLAVGTGTKSYSTTGSGTFTIKQRTNGKNIDLGAADTSTLLGLSTAELYLISAPTLTIGDANSGTINVSAVVAPPGSTFTTLALANNTTFAATGGFTSTVISASNYNKMTVAGTVNIAAGAAFTVTGGYVAQTNDSFTFLDNDLSDAIVGTFTGPTLANFLNQTLTATQTYTGGTNGNDFVVTLPAITQIPRIAISGAPLGTPYLWSTLAGSPGVAGTTDGTGGAARFGLGNGSPTDVVVDSQGNLFAADYANQTIRKCTPGGVVTTFAGAAGVAGEVDGTGGAARLSGPRGLGIDSSDNLYIADFDGQTIRKCTPAGVVTTIAGLANTIGTADGTGNVARFYNPIDVAWDAFSGNLFVVDRYNYTIRKVTLPGGVVTTFAGTAGANGNADGTGNAARFFFPYQIVADGTGNLYVADNSNDLVRKITSGAVVTTLFGGESSGTFAIARDAAGNIFVGYGDGTIQRTSTSLVRTLIGGSPNAGTSVDGVGSAARFNRPWGFSMDPYGVIYSSDEFEAVVRKGVPGVDFGSVAVSTSGTAQTLTINNLGSASLTITSVSTTGGNASEFGVNTSGMSSSVSASGSTNFTVTFSPTAVGIRNTTLRIVSSDPQVGTYDLALTGTAIALPDLTASLAHTGNFTQGQTGAQYTVTVNNTGGGVSSGTITAIITTLPAGLTATAFSGTGWTQTSLAPPTATFSGSLAATTGTNNALNLTVNVAANAPTSVTPVVTVSGGGQTNTTNDTGSSPTTIAQVASQMTANASTTPQSTLVNTAFATALSVTVKDAGNVVIPGVNVTFTAPGSGASGTFSNSTQTITVATNGSGIATAPFTANTTAGGPYSVVASAPGVTSVNFALTNNPGTAASFAISAPSNVTAGNTFSITVSAKDSFGNTTSYLGTAHFTSSDAQAVPPSNYTFVVGDNGVHAFTNQSTLKTAGSQTLTATDTVTSTITGTSSSITVSPGAATQLAYGQQPSTTVAGVAISSAPTVRVLDAFGNLATTATNVTLAIGTNPGSGMLSGTVTVLASGSIATFSTLSINKAGTGYTLLASSAGLTSATSSAFNITPASASQLAFGQQPTNTLAATSITPAVTVQIQDQFGNLTASSASVTISIGTNPGSGTLSGTTTVAAASGTATFPNLSINNVGTGYTLSAASGALTGATSSTFNITPATATHFTVTAPASATAGTAFSITVTALDASNNVATGYTGTVVFTKTDAGTGSLVPSNYTFVSGDNGVHTFTSGVTLVTAGNQTVTATDTTTASIKGTSSTIAVGPGAATQLLFVQQPSSTVAGVAISSAPTVRILDAFGNLTASTANVTIAIGTNPGGGTLGGGTTVAAAGGVATFSTLSINKSGTGYTLTATSAGLTGATSSTFNIAPAAASKLAFGQQPTNTVAATSITPAVTVQIQDPFGNIESADSTSFVTVSIGTNPSSGTLAGNTTITVVNGVATFSNLSINNVGNGYTLTAASGALTGATSSTFNVSPATATHFTVTAPGTATAGTAFSVTVTALDASNNVATGYLGTVTFTKTDAGVGSFVPSNYTFVSGDSGVHTFSNGVTLVTAGYQTVTATDTVTASIKGTSGNIGLAPAAQFSVASETVNVSAGSFSIAATLSAPPSFATGATPTGTSVGSGFNVPIGAAFDAAGNLYVANQANNTISKVTPGGAVSTFASGLNVPRYLAFDSIGNLYVSNNMSGTISKITVGGVVSTFASGFNLPEGLAFDSAGNLYVANSGDNTVIKVTSGGVLSTFASGFTFPRGLAFDAIGNLYVSNFNGMSVSKVTPNGTVGTFTTGFSSPDGLAFDTVGNLYVANAGFNTVLRVSQAGVMSPFASGFLRPTGLAFDSSGNLYVANFFTTAVSKLIPTVTVPFTLGGTAVAGTDFSGVTASPLTFTNGVTSQTITGTLLSDPVTPKTLTFAMGTPTGATLGTPTTNTLTINQLVSYGALTLNVWTVNTAGYTGTIAISGGTGAYNTKPTVTGLPNGITAALSGSTLTFSGTPTATVNTANNITVTVSDSLGASTTQTFTLAINANPSLGVQSVTAWTINSAFSDMIQINFGTGPFTLNTQTGLPVGLTASIVGSSIKISGTPTQTGNFTSIGFQITDAAGAQASSASYSITINAAPTLGALGTTAWTINKAYSSTITVGNGTTPYGNLTQSGLPAGLSAALSGNTIKISGTPTQSGTVSNLSISITDAANVIVAATYRLTINAAIAVTPSTLPGGTVYVAYSQTVGTTGGTGTATFAVTGGVLPAGLTLNGGTGALTGTPTLDGSTFFTITATDGVGATGATNYNVTIQKPTVLITLGGGTLPPETAGTAFNIQLMGGGGLAPYTFMLTTGTLPTGVTLSPSGLLSGTPTQAGSFPITITVTDSTPPFNGQGPIANGLKTDAKPLIGGPYTGTANYTLVIGAPTIVVNVSNLPNGRTGVAYTGSVSATGGVGPYTFAVTQGSLPAGLTLDKSGNVTGTPTADVAATFTVTATDSTAGTGPFTGSSPAVINTDRKPVFISGPTADASASVAGLVGTFTAVTDIPGAIITWNFGDGTSTATGALVNHLYGAPGTYTVAVTATNPVSGTSQTVILTVSVTNLNAVPGTDAVRVSNGHVKLGGTTDSISFLATLHYPAGVDKTKLPLTMTLGGLSQTFNFDASGKASNGSVGKAKLSVRSVHGVIPEQEAKVQIVVSGTGFKSLIGKGVALDANGLPTTIQIIFGFNGKSLSFINGIKFKTAGSTTNGTFGMK